MLIVVMVLGFPSFSFASGTSGGSGTTPDEKGKTYYVDPDGDDANSGTSSAAAWKTLQRVNRHRFAPADRVLFKRGGDWQGELLVSAQGTAERPVVIGAFGEGAAPRIRNTFDLATLKTGERYSVPSEPEAPDSISHTLRCRPGFEYALKLRVQAEGVASIGLRLSVNGNLYLRNERVTGVLSRWGRHEGWITINKSLSGEQEIPVLFRSPSVAMKTVQLTVKKTSGKGRVRVVAVRLEPRWTASPDFRNVFMLDTGLKATELVYDGRRLSRHGSVAVLEDRTYSVRDGVWFMKDARGNPEETGVSIQAVTSEQNALRVTGSKHVILEGVDICGGTGAVGYLGALGIYDSDHVEVRNCIVGDSTNAAIMIFQSRHFIVSKCDASNGGLAGIYVVSCADGVISGNDVHDNGACTHDLNDLHGIAVAGSRRITVEYNHVHHNGYGGGIGDRGDSAVTLYSGSDCVVRHNLIDHNWRGAVSVDSGHGGNSDRTAIRNNILADNGLLGEGGRYPALVVQAHSPSSSDYVQVANNTIIRQRTGDVWSLAAKKPQAASAGDRFKGRHCRGRILFWNGAYLVAAVSGTLDESDVLESVDGRWRSPVLRVNSAPAAIVLMSPLGAVRGASLQGNIVADTEGTYDLSVGRDVAAEFAGNCFWKKGGSLLFKENDISRTFFNKSRGGLFLNPGFKDSRTPEGLVPQEERCREAGAQPQLWLDKVVNP